MGRLKDENRDSVPLRRPIVAVVGASSAVDSVLALAEELGRAVAVSGWHLLCGGGSGVMEAACRGFVSVPPSDRGMTIGLLPSDRDGWANRYVEIPIATGMGDARNAIIARAASAVVSVGGCSGTLSEMANTQYLRVHHR